MKKYIKLIVAVVAFLLLLIGSGMLYTKLSQEYKPEIGLQATPESGETANEESAENDMSAETENGTSGQETTQNNEAQSVPAIDFTMENAAGEEVTLFSLVGKPMVLNFWASWCGPCKMELPDFQAAYEKYDGEIEFVLVNMTDGMQETKEGAMEFIESESYTLPFYFDTKQEAAYGYGVYSLPTTYFIDESGMIVAGAKGMLDAETLEVGIFMIYDGSE